MDETIRCAHCDQEIDASRDSCPACGHILSGSLPCARHPDRAAQGVCVVCGDPVCSECDNDSQVHHACPAHAQVPVIEGWAQIYTTSGTLDADLIRENLEAEGIDAAVLSQKDRSFNVDLGDLSPVRILVPAYEYLGAMKLLTSHMDLRGEVAFACPACGEPFDPADSTCSRCGTPLPTRAGRSPTP